MASPDHGVMTQWISAPYSTWCSRRDRPLFDLAGTKMLCDSFCRSPQSTNTIASEEMKVDPDQILGDEDCQERKYIQDYAN